MYDDILIPTDGSDGVQDAIEEGIALTKQTDATVHALYVIDNRDYGTVPDAEWMGLQEALENEGETAVEAVAERAENAGVRLSPQSKKASHRTKSLSMPTPKEST